MFKAMTMAIATAALAGPVPANVAGTVTAQIRSHNGDAIGSATIRIGSDVVFVRISVEGLPPGSYGVHFHEIGRCDAPTFESAGAHWNPTGRQHGGLNPHGYHLGDLPNLGIGSHGYGVLEYRMAATGVLAGANPLLDADGASIVIHREPDDYRTDPSGNSGVRLACGVLSS